MVTKSFMIPVFPDNDHGLQKLRKNLRRISDKVGIPKVRLPHYSWIRDIYQDIVMTCIMSKYMCYIQD